MSKVVSSQLSEIRIILIDALSNIRVPKILDKLMNFRQENLFLHLPSCYFATKVNIHNSKLHIFQFFTHQFFHLKDSKVELNNLKTGLDFLSEKSKRIQFSNHSLNEAESPDMEKINMLRMPHWTLPINKFRTWLYRELKSFFLGLELETTSIYTFFYLAQGIYNKA